MPIKRNQKVPKLSLTNCQTAIKYPLFLSVSRRDKHILSDKLSTFRNFLSILQPLTFCGAYDTMHVRRARLRHRCNHVFLPNSSKHSERSHIIMSKCLDYALRHSYYTVNQQTVSMCLNSPEDTSLRRNVTSKRRIL